MRVMILGVDGYLGFPLAMHLKSRGHEVLGVDNGVRRERVDEVGGVSAFRLETMQSRARQAGYAFIKSDVASGAWSGWIGHELAEFKPDAIVHLAEQPSAPYSMKDDRCCEETVRDNVLGTIRLLWGMRHYCPDAHLLKLGTMGEYGTPDVDIPEGWFDLSFRDKTTKALFPRQPGSFYHCSKVADSTFIEFACRTWGMRSTDVMQGVVYGTRTPEMGSHPIDPQYRTRFDADAVFGTVINRFVAAAVLEAPITPYGTGYQSRGFLPLQDSIQCMRILLESPPHPSEYRVVNQLDEVCSIGKLALVVADAANEVGLKPDLKRAENPRVEREDHHHYKPDTEILRSLGYEPRGSLREVVREMIEDLLPLRERLVALADALDPGVSWRL